MAAAKSAMSCMLEIEGLVTVQADDEGNTALLYTAEARSSAHTPDRRS